MTQLKRYWFQFESPGSPGALNLGCGVTAYDYDDAISVLRTSIFRNREMPTITDYKENVDISTLDPKHILPNIGSVLVRGVWWPQGHY